MSHLLTGFFIETVFSLQTALDLSAPATDAILINRKNAWIQLAGHPGSFAPAGPHTIWKKRMAKENYELKAYQSLMDSPTTQDIIPEFHREVEHNGEYFIEIEDLLQHFKDPNIMDIKMGKRTFLESEVKNPVLRKDLYQKMIDLNPNAPTEEERKQEAITKLRYMQFREEGSSTATLGFRIEAVKKSGEAPITSLKKIKHKSQVKKACVNFLLIEHCMVLPWGILVLKGQKKVEKTHLIPMLLQIIGSSLLIMYDESGHCGVWLIDFAKTIPVENGMILYHNLPWLLGNHEDGFLSGLDNLIDVRIFCHSCK
ncbi:hypothetical protein LOTGIDRAFT_132004 [Lottia gigantea]|uniref:Kinase n=1 Tax=Lottia gigantea TaxID=225164 RepID=V3Z1U1_LOTGI|nr:hypothetical protein LOTGIDRAFT_132004 [Lottia gigantea]ESO84513.1 hypothetical protein LOTGIDRAFT_132004 [Lottia gigantea]